MTLASIAIWKFAIDEMKSTYPFSIWKKRKNQNNLRHSCRSRAQQWHNDCWGVYVIVHCTAKPQCKLYSFNGNQSCGKIISHMIFAWLTCSHYFEFTLPLVGTTTYGGHFLVCIMNLIACAAATTTSSAVIFQFFMQTIERENDRIHTHTYCSS